MSQESVGATVGVPPSKERRIGRWALGGVVVAAIAVGAWSVTQSDGGAEAVETSPLKFAEVIRTDLVEETEYDGTLGRPSGDAIGASGQGTVTALPEPGDTLVQGDTAYEIDGDPVILLYGATPQYRTLALSDDEISVHAKAPGTITAVLEPGTSVKQGDVLYEVNGEPVVALYGAAPAYRQLADFSTNLTGDDVAQLEEALDALGYVSTGEMTVDDEFTGATASVVEEWQSDIGAADDGRVDLGEVVFILRPTEVATSMLSIGDTVGNGQEILTLSGSEAMVGVDVEQLEVALVALGFDAEGAMQADGVFTPETADAVRAFEKQYSLDIDGRVTAGEVVFVDDAVRVSDTLASLGSTVNPGSPVLAVTGEQTLVIVNLPAADQGTLVEGMAVIVELPDQTEVPATVVSVATVATAVGNETVFEVEITLDDAAAASGLDEAPVDVKVVSDSVEDVIAVPVAALLALAEGGYAVEVDAGGGQTRLVAVDPGFFADGFVEVDGDLQPGDQVVIP